MKLVLFSDLIPTYQAQILKWWSTGTKTEDHLISLEPAQIKISLLEAIVAIEEGQIIGVAGIFHARTKDGEVIIHDNKPVAEFGSNYIKPTLRDNGVGSELLRRRIQIAPELGYFPVSVTTNQNMLRIFKKEGGKHMKKRDPYFLELKDKLCICPEEDKASCKYCPHTEKAAWYFTKK